MSGRTSETHPLKIAEVAAGRGRIGVTLCPGKRGDSLFGGRWERDLEADLAAIRTWGAAAVATLIEEHEFTMLDVEALPRAVREAGLEWHWLPIADVDVPDGGFETRWVFAGLRLRELVRSGQRVLVHCRGGLGRAGMVAAALLVELNEHSASKAIEAVRRARPGAIETPAQERWVKGRRSIDAGVDARRSHELACLLGGAIGDALGYRVEFQRWAEIQREYGSKGIQLGKAQGPLVVSDDTQMTLFTLEGQARAAREDRPVVESIRAAYLDWYGTQSGRWRAADVHAGLLGHRVMWRQRAPGNTCMSALAAGGQGTTQAPINDSKGCGGVMRTATLGFLGSSYPDAEVYRLGTEAAALTHGHPDGWAPAGAMALAVRLLMAGHEWPDVTGAALAAVQGAHPQATRTADLLQQVSAALIAGAKPRSSASFGEGWVGEEALAVGLHAAATAGSFSDAIEAAANHDGDSDSTASIAGQLYGAKHGIEGLPAEAVYRIDVLEALLELFGEWGQIAKR